MVISEIAENNSPVFGKISPNFAGHVTFALIVIDED